MRQHLLAAAAYLVLAVVFALPASLQPADSLVGNGGDNYLFAWNLWYFAKAVGSGENPFYTDLIFYPYGANLAWTTLDPLVCFLALPLSWTVGPVVAYNLSVVLLLTLAAVFAYLLCWRVCGDWRAAFIGGMIFGFSPFLLGRALAHLNLLTAFPIPLYLIALDRLFVKDTPTWKEGVGLGVALLLTSLAFYQYTVFCIFLSVTLLAVDLAFEGTSFLKRIWFPLVISALTFLVGFLPFLFMLLGNPEDIPAPPPLRDVERFSADLLGFFIPSVYQWIFGPYVWKLAPPYSVSVEGIVYVGVLASVLAWIGFRSGWAGGDRHRRWATRALVAATIFALLSLGPKLRLLGTPLDIPGPAAMLYEIESMRFLREPGRFHVITVLCLAVLACLGTVSLLGKLHTVSRKNLFVVLLVAGLVFEYATLPFPHSSLVDPGWHFLPPTTTRQCSIPPEVRGCTVLTLPAFDGEHWQKAMWMQLMDGGRYRLVDGHTSHVPERVSAGFRQMPILSTLLSFQTTMQPTIDIGSDRQAMKDFVRRLNLCAVVVFGTPDRPQVTQYVRDLFALEGQAVGTCTVFRLTRN